MFSDAVHIRPAMRHEARTIAKLFLISSDGLAAYVWQQLAGPDDLLLAVGAKRYARDDIPCSYKNCLVAERAGRIIGMVHSVPIEDDLPDCYIPELPGDAVLKPYKELTSHQPPSLFVSGLAVFPAARRQGVGSRLLAAVRERARGLGLDQLSLICFEPNEGACRLYRSQGFAVTARRPLVPHPLLHYSAGDALLMVAPSDPIGAMAEPQPEEDDARPFLPTALPAAPTGPLHHCGQPIGECQCS
ncbi:MAG TPA: GNAT family N-acetyltransferase [Kiloniellales bacterium]|nr:GNAT family N-acetyltransferase [Kiloniellales bacterium]